MRLDQNERQLISSRDLCRLSTIGKDGWPHSAPVGYVFQRGRFYIPSLKRSQKVANLERNNKATIVVDEEESERGIMIKCASKILYGDDAEPLRRYMRKVKGWENDETTVVIELTPTEKASWFLK